MENWRRFLLKEDLTIDNNFYDDVNRWAQTKRSGLEQLGVKVSPAGEADTLTVLFADLEPKLTKIRQIGSELSPAFHLEFENVDKEELAPYFGEVEDWQSGENLDLGAQMPIGLMWEPEEGKATIRITDEDLLERKPKAAKEEDNEQ